MDVKIVRNVLEENDALADDVRRQLRTTKQSMFNFMSAPGSGKTRLLERLIPALKKKGFKIGVIEGDITTSCDADRLKPFDIPIAQINTEVFGGDCHLGANVVLGGLRALCESPTDIILLENVGNLVCPAEFDTGSDLNVVLLSVTEGEDKPLKYPLMFRNSQVALINKIDLAEAAEADVALMKKNMLKINSDLIIIETSGKTGQGLETLTRLIIEKYESLLGTR